MLSSFPTPPPNPLNCCRYHYNVHTQRLLTHVKKGWEDGLYISCVGCCDNLWGVVMDAGTNFTQQIYKVSHGAGAVVACTFLRVIDMA